MKPARDRIARILMILLGIASVGAFANSALELQTIAPDRVPVEAWRMLAFLVFAGLFILLGAFPRRMTGVWELVFFHKAAVPLFLLFFVHARTAAPASFTDASMVAVDIGLAVVILFSYVMAQGWRAWRPAA